MAGYDQHSLYVQTDSRRWSCHFELFSQTQDTGLLITHYLLRSSHTHVLINIQRKFHWSDWLEWHTYETVYKTDVQVGMPVLFTTHQVILMGWQLTEFSHKSPADVKWYRCVKVSFWKKKCFVYTFFSNLPRMFLLQPIEDAFCPVTIAHNTKTQGGI